MNFLEKLINFKFAFFIVLVMFAYELFINKSYYNYKIIKDEIASIKFEINNLNELNNKLKKDIDELKNNSRILEIKARMDLGLVKEHEIIYEIKD